VILETSAAVGDSILEISGQEAARTLLTRETSFPDIMAYQDLVSDHIFRLSEELVPVETIWSVTTTYFGFVSGV
jgi:UDP-N-acetylglucosamine transferase subunit ALG13